MKNNSDKTVLVRARVPARRLQRAERVLDRLGLKPGDAINMLMAQVELRQGLPFPVSIEEGPLLNAEIQADEWTEAMGAY